MNMDDEQPLMAPTEQQPLVGKQTTWSRRTLALGALFGASLLLGAAVSARNAPAAATPAGKRAAFNTKTGELVHKDFENAAPIENNYLRKRAKLEAAIRVAFEKVHGRAPTADELRALVEDPDGGVRKNHPELVEANPDLVSPDIVSACITLRGDFVCTKELSDYPELYLWFGLDFDHDAGFCYTLFVGVDIDFSFDITAGVCLSGIPEDDMEYGKEVTLYHTGFTAALLEVGVSAQVFSFDLEESLRQKAVRDRAAYDAAMARLTADGHDAAKFGQLADAFFRRAKGRAPTEAERPGATAEFAAKLGAARAKKAAAGATVATKADKPEFFWGDDVIGLWDDGGSWFWDDWEISIDDWFDTTLKCEQYPYCGAPPGQDPEDYCPNGLAKVEVRIPVIAQVDAYGSGELSVGTPTLESGFGAIDIEFSANAGVTAEAIEVMAAGVEGKISTECDTSSCSYPDMEICAFAELKFPDFELPSWDICGNEIGFDFDLPSLGLEECWDV